MRKADLRRQMLARRSTLPPHELARRSDKLCEGLFRNFPVAEWGWLHLFLPFFWARGLPPRAAGAEDWMSAIVV